MYPPGPKEKLEMVVGGFAFRENLRWWNCRLAVPVLLLLFLLAVCEVDTLKCHTAVPVPVSHELYQSGDFVIGGIVSQFICCFHEFSFKEYPWQEFSDLNA